MSGDRDMYQLVTDRVLVLTTAMRPGRRLIGPKHIEARYGVPPSAWCCRTGAGSYFAGQLRTSVTCGSQPPMARSARAERGLPGHRGR